MDYPPYTQETDRAVWDEARRIARTPVAPTVDLASLPAEQKRQVWEYLKRQHPQMATLLQSAWVQSIRESFDARVRLPKEMVDEALHGH